MKKIVLLFVILFGAFNLQAQNYSSTGRVGYINTEEILNSIPEYKVAQDKLETLSNEYQSRIESEYKKIESLYKQYQSMKASLSEAVKSQKENDIITKERAVKELQNSYFGEDGTMKEKSDEYLTPIKNRVQKAIDIVAEKGNYMLLIDIASMQGVVYAKESDNLNKLILNILEN